MRCHLATAVTIEPPTGRPGGGGRNNPLRALTRVLSRPLSDGLTLPDHLVAGGAASAVAVSAMHPMDTLKTVLQKAPSASAAAASAGNASAAVAPRPNVVSALVSTLRTGGPAALYRGLAPSLLSQVPAGSIKFAAYELFTQCARSLLPPPPSSSLSSPSTATATAPATGGSATVRPRAARGLSLPPAVVDFTCAAMAFVVCSVVLVPGELLKQRMQAGVYSGVASGVAATLRAHGVRGLYVGYAATLARDVPYTMLEFGLYAQFKRALRAVLRKDRLTTREELTMGGIAGGCTGFLTTPLDLAKTRLMTQSATAGAGAGAGAGAAAQARYKGIFDVLVRVAREDGVQGLFKGSAARVVWLVPFTAIYFGMHEATKRVLLERRKARLQQQQQSKKQE